MGQISATRSQHAPGRGSLQLRQGTLCVVSRPLLLVTRRRGHPAVSLLWKAPDGQRGTTLVFLGPCAAAKLVRSACSWGAGQIGLHVAQSTAPLAETRGIVFPTIMPETA